MTQPPSKIEPGSCAYFMEKPERILHELKHLWFEHLTGNVTLNKRLVPMTSYRVIGFAKLYLGYRLARYFGSNAALLGLAATTLEWVDQIKGTQKLENTRSLSLTRGFQIAAALSLFRSLKGALGNHSGFAILSLWNSSTPLLKGIVEFARKREDEAAYLKEHNFKSREGKKRYGQIYWTKALKVVGIVPAVASGVPVKPIPEWKQPPEDPKTILLASLTDAEQKALKLADIENKIEVWQLQQLINSGDLTSIDPNTIAKRFEQGSYGQEKWG